MINKKTIADAIAEKHDLTKRETADIVDLVFEEISNALKDGGRVDITGFGKFEVKSRASRKGVNPRTKETMDIAETKVPKFKASKVLKAQIK